MTLSFFSASPPPKKLDGAGRHTSTAECGSLSALEDRGDAHPAGGAAGRAPAAGPALGKLLGERRDDARAGGGERVSHRDARAFRVELRALDASQRSVAAEPLLAVFPRFPRLERAQHLRAQGF